MQKQRDSIGHFIVPIPIVTANTLRHMFLYFCLITSLSMFFKALYFCFGEIMVLFVKFNKSLFIFRDWQSRNNLSQVKDKTKLRSMSQNKCSKLMSMLPRVSLGSVIRRNTKSRQASLSNREQGHSFCLLYGLGQIEGIRQVTAWGKQVHLRMCCLSMRQAYILLLELLMGTSPSVKHK